MNWKNWFAVIVIISLIGIAGAQTGAFMVLNSEKITRPLVSMSGTNPNIAVNLSQQNNLTDFRTRLFMPDYGHLYGYNKSVTQGLDVYEGVGAAAIA